MRSFTVLATCLAILTSSSTGVGQSGWYGGFSTGYPIVNRTGFDGDAIGARDVGLRAIFEHDGGDHELGVGHPRKSTKPSFPMS